LCRALAALLPTIEGPKRLMSNYGEVFIYPEQFFEVVGAFRNRFSRSQGSTEVVVPDALHDGANTSLGALATVIADAGVALTANLEIASRLLTTAAANAIDADMQEEGLNDWTHLASPDETMGGRAPTDDVGLYGAVFDFVEGDS
jgi:hypothetical protein